MLKELRYITEYPCDGYTDVTAWEEFKKSAFYHEHVLFCVVCETNNAIHSCWVVYQIIL
jgi:hypothetical protein